MMMVSRAEIELRKLTEALSSEDIEPEVEYGPQGHIVACWCMADYVLTVSFEPDGDVGFMRMYKRA